MNYLAMDAFAALADPTRRRIVEMLSVRPLSAGEIGEGFTVSAPAISQHLKTLREAGLVRVTVAGQRRIYALDLDGIDGFDRWVARVRGFWPDRLQALQNALEQDALEAELSEPETGKGE